MTSVRVFVASGHDLLRACLSALVAEQPHLALVGETPDLASAPGVCRRLVPDVALLGSFGAGSHMVEAVREFCRACPDVKVLMVGSCEHPEAGIFVRRAFRAGVAGYVDMDSPASGLITAIALVHRDRSRLSFSTAVSSPRLKSHSRSGKASSRWSR